MTSASFNGVGGSARPLIHLGDEGADGGVLEVGDAVEFADEAFVDVGEFSSGLVVEVGGGEVGREGAAGFVAKVGWVPVEGGSGKEDEVAGLEGHAVGLLICHDGDGAHFGGEVEEGDPGGEHLGGVASEPAGLLAVPVVVDVARRTGFFVEELVVPEANFLEREGFADEGGEAAVAEEVLELGAEEGDVGVFAGADGAGAGLGPLEGGGEVGLALVIGILSVADAGDFS